MILRVLLFDNSEEFRQVSEVRDSERPFSDRLLTSLPILETTYGQHPTYSSHYGQYIAHIAEACYTKAMLTNLLTPVETQLLLSNRLKALRLVAGYKRTTLARLAGVSESSLKRFENTGEISLKYLLRLSHTLGRLQEFCSLFEELEAETLAELKAGSRKKIPKRGRI